MNKSANKIGLLMLGRPQFEISLAEKYYESVTQVVKQAGFDVEKIAQPITVEAEVSGVVDVLKKARLTAVVVVQGTFTDASMVLSLAHSIDLPLLIWSFKEEPTGERLSLNSFCGLNLAAHALAAAGKKFKGVYGNPDSAKVCADVLAFLRAAVVVNSLKGKKIGIVGNRPGGYYPSNFNEIALAGILGITVNTISLQEVFDLGNSMSCDIHPLVDNLEGLNRVDTAATQKSVNAYYALKEVMAKKSLDAIAVECWPDFMVKYGGAVCFALSQLNDDGVVAACEADVNGAVSMQIGQILSGQATFIADLVTGDSEKNELIFWHCGNGPRSLLSPNYPPVAGVHPNRKMPLSVYGPLKDGPVTICRISPDQDGKLRLLIGKGTGLEAPMLYSGNTLPVHTETPVEGVLQTLLKKGLEHHYVVIYGDYVKELQELAQLLDLETIEF
ncbi:L-fucose/L-arabinose isomerase family protein [Desulfitobacterium sp.]|uniref:L-fucose/L-arabinose isomerase family protein n=1 Tax=Desulfitobacterium sp. TaxID=49981 RepID=UPI002B2087B3|nr:L-fucose/L-arabinose isomerase family protein [Desulfitobacterium sp.]MEA4900681.1 L-fucose/L-arabinose isomerase family protein [Desulfitobacterium sp.]